ncbi:MAG: hypothetical protein GWM90_07900 [Gemmatimonadetes bacterium]|nr:hypothetical protein [Gemmatimonadota bacterium]NIQ53793.1 hypothetical protein [Gemmatimonadota bacterium]NIU73964.1 hypothetical protein [Gammaproteobacteria bacterium]NIX44035.1 hypothetical protein [Gemmatimonadota bacterium]NIY08248.1 hypothetical protein [Gemmatimonadota bacterium]
MRMRRSRRATSLTATGLVLGLSAALSGCASTPDALSAQELEGCFYFERYVVADGAIRLPWGVRLSREPLEGWPMASRGDVRLAATLTVDGDVDHPFGYWLPSGDSVEIGYPAGGGLVLELEVVDMALEGVVRPLGDARSLDAPEPEPAAVRLTRARCPEQ